MSLAARAQKNGGWEKAPLGEVVEILDSRRVPVNREERKNRVGDVPYYGATGQVGWIDRHLFDEELVLLGEDGAPFLDSAKPKAYLVRGKSWVNNHAHVLRAKPGLLNSFLLYQLNCIDYRPYVSGTTRLKLPQGPMRQIPLLVPTEDEQRRIVAEIEKQFTRLEAGVAGLRRVQANFKRYRAAVLKAACEGKLVPTEAELARERKKVAAASRRWSSKEERRRNASATFFGENQSRDGSATQEGPGYETGAQLLERILTERRKKWNGKGKYKEPVKPDTSNLPVLPEDWAWARLDAIAALKGGITVDKNRKSATARRTPYLRVANVQRGYLDLSEIKEIEAPEADIDDLRLLPGDILFTEGGDRDKLGRGWIWQGQISECIHQNHVFRARLYSAVIEPKFLSWWGNSFGQVHFLREGKQTTNLASINLSKLSQFPIPIPPAAEQRRIVAEVERRLSVVEELERVVNANLQRADRLRQAILQRNFSGKLSTTRKLLNERC